MNKRSLLRKMRRQIQNSSSKQALVGIRLHVDVLSDTLGYDTSISVEDDASVLWPEIHGRIHAPWVRTTLHRSRPITSEGGICLETSDGHFKVYEGYWAEPFELVGESHPMPENVVMRRAVAQQIVDRVDRFELLPPELVPVVRAMARNCKNFYVDVIGPYVYVESQVRSYSVGAYASELTRAVRSVGYPVRVRA